MDPARSAEERHVEILQTDPGGRSAESLRREDE
jgi:hypothetical protein